MLSTGAVEMRSRFTLLVDSGAFAHVCPVSFATNCPIRPPTRQLNVRTASGQKIKHLGTRRVTFRDAEGGTFDIDFVVCCGIQRVIVSVGALRNESIFTYFDENPRVEMREQRIPLKQINQLFF